MIIRIIVVSDGSSVYVGDSFEFAENWIHKAKLDFALIGDFEDDFQSSCSSFDTGGIAISLFDHDTGNIYSSAYSSQPNTSNFFVHGFEPKGYYYQLTGDFSVRLFEVSNLDNTLDIKEGFLAMHIWHSN